MMLTIITSEFDPEYALVASQFRQHKAQNELFFGRLDFQDGQATYQKVKKSKSKNGID